MLGPEIHVHGCGGDTRGNGADDNMDSLLEEPLRVHELLLDVMRVVHDGTWYMQTCFDLLHHMITGSKFFTFFSKGAPTRPLRLIVWSCALLLFAYAEGQRAAKFAKSGKYSAAETILKLFEAAPRSNAITSFGLKTLASLFGNRTADAGRRNTWDGARRSWLRGELGMGAFFVCRCSARVHGSVRAAGDEGGLSGSGKAPGKQRGRGGGCPEGSRPLESGPCRCVLVPRRARATRKTGAGKGQRGKGERAGGRVREKAKEKGGKGRWAGG